jgi:hypothetical protein
VCAHACAMHSATSAAEDHEDAYTRLLPLCKKNMILLDGYLMIIINISP